VLLPCPVYPSMHAWTQASIFDKTAQHCMHGPKCKVGARCEAGRRVRTVHLLAGATLPLWTVVEDTLASVARQRNFAVIQVAETAAATAAAPSSQPIAGDGAVKQEAGSAGGGGDAVKHEAEVAATAVTTDGTVEVDEERQAGRDDRSDGPTQKKQKVIGILLPSKHAPAVLQAVADKFKQSGQCARASCPTDDRETVRVDTPENSGQF
jgi:hypothetical protein